MREKVAAQEILELRAIEALRVFVVVRDEIEHVARVTRFRGGFELRDQLAHSFFVARARATRGERNGGDESRQKFHDTSY